MENYEYKYILMKNGIKCVEQCLSAILGAMWWRGAEKLPLLKQIKIAYNKNFDGLRNGKPCNFLKLKDNSSLEETLKIISDKYIEEIAEHGYSPEQVCVICGVFCKETKYFNNESDPRCHACHKIEESIRAYEKNMWPEKPYFLNDCPLCENDYHVLTGHFNGKRIIKCYHCGILSDGINALENWNMRIMDKLYYPKA